MCVHAKSLHSWLNSILWVAGGSQLWLHVEMLSLTCFFIAFVIIIKLNGLSGGPCSSVVVQLLRHVRLFETPWTAEHQASLSFTISQSLLKLMSIESVMPFNHLILCHPLLLLPSTFPNIRVFSNELALLIRWLKYWSFSISPSNEYSGLISFRIDWFYLLLLCLIIN